MFARLSHEKPGTPLPQKWIDKVTELIGEVYKEPLASGSWEVFIWGKAWDKEILCTFGLVKAKRPEALPITLIVSQDIHEKTEIKDVLEGLIDFAGEFFDSYFATGECDYSAVWQETTFKNGLFYRKTTRENVAHSLAADALLGL